MAARSTVRPSLGLGADRIEKALAAAVLAPSLHNSQPWRFRLYPDVIELHAHPGRRLAVADPAGHEQRIGCGAALFNLRIALLDAGIRPLVTLLPDAQNPDLVAAIRRGGPCRIAPEPRRLLDAVPRRRTNRRPFLDASVSPEDLLALRRAATEEGAWLHLVTDAAQRAELGRLARRGHRVQTADPAFVAELDAWTGHTDGRSDGVPARAGGPFPAPNQTWVTRDYTGGGGDGDPTAFEPDPVIGVLSTHSDGPRHDVRAGQAMQRVLLTATAHGLAASFLSQLVEVPDIRLAVGRLISGGRPPHVVLRLGHGLPVAATPRRAPADVVVAADGSDGS